MAYWNWNERLDNPLRPKRPRRILCDPCAEAGEVRFKVLDDGLPMQEHPWRWAPQFGAACHKCGRPA